MAKTAEVNSQRIVQAVRRIAATVLQEDSPLDAAKPKARIGKTRGAAYYNSNGDIDSGDEVPAEAVDPEKDDDSSTKKRDYQPISDDHQEGDTVDEIEAFDCATGQKIQLDLAPEEGIEFDPPPGWDNPDGHTEFPFTDDGTYQAGYVWHNHSIHNGYFATVSGAYAADSWPGSYRLHYDGVSWRAQYKNGFGNWINVSTYHKVLCSVYLSVGACSVILDPVAATSWPSDNTTTLILKDGTFQAHQMDPDAADAYKNTPPSSIEVCDGQGNRFSVSALENGRSMITKLNPDGTVPESGHSLIIDRYGKVANKIGNKVRDGYL